jgi:hypothetical protein
MNKLKHIIAFWVLISMSQHLFAQRKKDAAVEIGWAQAQVVDGLLDEWGTLRYQYSTQGFRFDVRNDQTYLYIALLIEDSASQHQALMHGVTWMINPKGKKREDRSITYPLIDRVSMRTLMGGERKENAREEMIGAVRGIYVQKFDDLVDGYISLDNTYGVSALAKVNQQDHLVIEMAIPLKRLGFDSNHKGDIALNLKINGAPLGALPQMGNNNNISNTTRGVYPAMGSRVYGSTRPRVETGLWIITKLANTKNNS